MREERPGRALFEGEGRVITPERVERWLKAVPLRHSRRSYTGEPVPSGSLDALESLAASFRPWSRVRAVLVREAPASVFLGIVGSYGGISGAPSAIVLVGEKDVPGERIGYVGEALVLEATALGLDTCWVGGFFSAAATRRLVSMEDGERVHAIIALGHAQQQVSRKERVLFGQGRAKHRRALEEIAGGAEGWPTWVRQGLEAVRVAPSAMNRQPWRFSYDEGSERVPESIVVSFDGPDAPKISKRLDCGIAMLHFELGVMAEGVRGTWESLDSPQVARYECE